MKCTEIATAAQKWSPWALGSEAAGMKPGLNDSRKTKFIKTVNLKEERNHLNSRLQGLLLAFPTAQLSSSLMRIATDWMFPPELRGKSNCD